MKAQQKKVQDRMKEVRAQTELRIRFAVVNAVFSGYPSVLVHLSVVLLTIECIARFVASPLTKLMRNQGSMVSHHVISSIIVLISFPRIVYDAPANRGKFGR